MLTSGDARVFSDTGRVMRLGQLLSPRPTAQAKVYATHEPCLLIRHTLGGDLQTELDALGIQGLARDLGIRTPCLFGLMADGQGLGELMEHLGEQTYLAWARQEPDLNRRLAPLLGVLPGFHSLHRLGLVHSDLKPPHVLVLEDGPPQLAILDWGCAVPVGTPVRGVSRAYAPPETEVGRTLAQAGIDLFALTVLACMALTELPVEQAKATRLFQSLWPVRSARHLHRSLTQFLENFLPARAVL